MLATEELVPMISATHYIEHSSILYLSIREIADEAFEVLSGLPTYRHPPDAQKWIDENGE